MDRFTTSAWGRLRVALRAASATNGDDTAPPRLRAAEAAGYAGNGDAGASRRHRLAVTVVFAGNGMLFASLFARLPEVQARLGLSEGELGLALLGAPVGLVAAVWPAGAWVVRAGSRRVSAAGAAAFVAAVALPALAGGLAPLVAAMVLLGAASGTLDVAMNAQGVTVERRYPRRIFASLHAGFSFGALAGALSSGLAAEAGFALGLHLAAVGLIIGCAMAASIRAFLPDAGQPEDGAGFARPTGPLRAIGAVALCALLAEGALNDWSAVYLADVQGAAPGLAAAGLAAFSSAMGVGRLAGDRLAARVGGARLASSGLLVAAAGFAGAAAAPGAAASLIAFVTLGLGLAAVYPLCLRIAAEQPGIPAAAAIAAVTTTGYTGFLAGPPLVGFVAEATSLRISLVAVGTLCAAAAALASSASPGSRPPRPQASARARRRAAGSTAR